MKYFFGIIILLFITNLFGQEITLKGKVTDSLQQPLPFANIMAENLEAKMPPLFTMTDESGDYSLMLLKKYTYQISILYMGYKPVRFQVDSLYAAETIVKNIVLYPQQNQLNEVVITADVPVRIQEDTITYKTDKFTTGEERKLKDVLKKLPGIEVNKSGQVTVMGKKVSSVLVEGKEFFGGGTKLAVDNIPADAVAEVVAIDDYNSIGFMKGLTDEQKMIINIKLKEGKKHFVFGDIVAGTGNNKHYLAKANLFYYSPKTNLSYIGNLNDAGESPMTLDDFIRFENSLMDMEKLKSSYQSFKDISTIIMPDNFLNKQDNFHALQWQQDFGKKIEWNTYVIYAENQTGFFQTNKNTYLYNGIIEKKDNQKKQNNESELGKIHFRYKKNIFNYLDFSLYLKRMQVVTNNNVFSYYNQNINYILHQEKNDNLNLNLYLGWHHQLNKQHTFRWQNTFNANRNLPDNNWQTNNEIFNPLMPLLSDDSYVINQKNEKKNWEWNTEIKHYWILSPKQHVYFSLSNHLAQQQFVSLTSQLLSDKNIHTFESSGFNNNLQLDINDVVGGIQYKFKHLKSIFKFGVFAHYTTWGYSEDFSASDDLFYIAPEFSFDKKIKYTRNLSLKYRLINRILSVENNLMHYYLTDYNKLSKGNIDVRNELMHTFLLSYRDFSIAKDYQYYINLSYQQKQHPIQSKVIYQDLASFSMPVTMNAPIYSWRVNFFIKHDYKKIFIQLKPVLQYNFYHQYIQNKLYDIFLFSQQYELTLGSYFQKYPNFDVGVTYNKRIYDLSLQKQITHKLIPFVEVNYDFGEAYNMQLNYQLHNDYNYDNKSNIYHIANFSFIFQKDNQPWGVEITAKNLFNNTFINTYNQSDILVSEQKIFIQPRIVMLKIHYKL